MYDSETPEDLIAVIERALNLHQRIKVTYPEGHSESGYVTWSVGPRVKAMLLAHNSRSLGGNSVHTARVVKVETTRGKRVLWEKGQP